MYTQEEMNVAKMDDLFVEFERLAKKSIAQGYNKRAFGFSNSQKDFIELLEKGLSEIFGEVTIEASEYHNEYNFAVNFSNGFNYFTNLTTFCKKIEDRIYEAYKKVFREISMDYNSNALKDLEEIKKAYEAYMEKEEKFISFKQKIILPFKCFLDENKRGAERAKAAENRVHYMKMLVYAIERAWTRENPVQVGERVFVSGAIGEVVKVGRVRHTIKLSSGDVVSRECFKRMDVTFNNTTYAQKIREYLKAFHIPFSNLNEHLS